MLTDSRFRSPQDKRTIRLLGCLMAVSLGIEMITNPVNTHGGPQGTHPVIGSAFIAFGVLFGIGTLWWFRKKKQRIKRNLVIIANGSCPDICRKRFSKT
jgi:hypothetical protein